MMIVVVIVVGLAGMSVVLPDAGAGVAVMFALLATMLVTSTVSLKPWMTMSCRMS